MPRRRYRRRGERATAPGRQGPRRASRVALAGAGLAVALAAVLLVVSWRLWFSPSREAAAIEACGGARCQVILSVAVGGSPLAETMSFVVESDTSVEIDFVFRGLPVSPQQLRLITPEDQRWLVAEGTLEHPETWAAPTGEGPAWVTGWDRAGNGRGPLRRWWRTDPAAPSLFVLEAPMALQSPSLEYVVGSDALLTVGEDTPPGNYVLALEAAGYDDGRLVTARARLIVSVVPPGSTLSPGEAPMAVGQPRIAGTGDSHVADLGESCSD